MRKILLQAAAPLPDSAQAKAAPAPGNYIDRAQGFIERLYDWIILKGPALILAIVVLIGGLWLIGILSRFIGRQLQKKEVDASLKPFIISLSAAVLRVLLFLAVLQIAGIQMTIFAALVASVGVAAGLALSGTLQNFASGILILLLKPFEVGDNILAQGQEGTVTAIRIFYTIVTTYDNRTVVIPNSKLSNEVIVNISSSGNRRLDIELKFSNAIDFDEIKKQIEAAIDDAGNVLHEPKRRIGISSVEPDGYKVMLNLWLEAHGFTDAKMIFQEKLMRRLRQSGLKLPGM